MNKRKQKSSKPPILAEGLIKIFFPDKGNYSTVGDIHEQYNYLVSETGSIKAKIWYVRQTVKSILPLFTSSIYWSLSMIRNYIKFAWRNIKKNKLYSAINIVGLAIGIAICAFLFQYIRLELSYDKHHENAENIYRITEENYEDDKSVFTASSYPPVADILANDFPEFENVVRLYPLGVSITTPQNAKFNETGFCYADSTYFDVFTHKFLAGNKDAALQNPFRVVLTKSIADKYFGNENPVGQMLKVEDGLQFMVDAVIEDFPQSSHFRFDILASMSSLRSNMDWFFSSWHYPPVYIYALANSGFNLPAFNDRVYDFHKKYFREGEPRRIQAQPLLDIHLASDLENEIGVNTSIEYIYLLGGIGILILVIACINFMNLNTARAESRAKEVGIKKVVGAERKSLMVQFFLEAITYSIAALFFAVFIIEALKGPFSEIVGTTIQINYIFDLYMTIGFIAIALLVGFASGLYPAVYLSRFKPTEVFQKSLSGTRNRTNINFRNVLVGFQFAVSFFLILTTIIVFDQVEFIRNKNLGFSAEQTLIFPLKDKVVQNKLESIRNRILTDANITSVTAASSIPGIDRELNYPFNVDGMPFDETVSLNTILTDHDFLTTLQIELISGRNFSREITTDEREAFIVNETAAKQFGWDDPINKKIRAQRYDHGLEKKVLREGSVIGVVKDFHWESLQNEIEPLLIQISYQNYFYDYMAVKFSGQNSATAIAHLEKIWNETVPHRAMEYNFLDKKFEEMFLQEQRLFTMFSYSAGIAIIVACLGLFGLSVYIVQKRTKEIGIRKVLGASSQSITVSLIVDILKPLVLSVAVGLPVAVVFTNSWLENFAYRIDTTMWSYLPALLVLLTIAVVTVSFQAIKASHYNPVDSIRSE